MNQLRKVNYRSGLLDPPNLTSLEKINHAMNEFSAVINRDNYIQVLDDLLDQSHVVELILSGLIEEIPLKEWILDGFPTSPKLFEASFAQKLLSKLSDFFLFHSSSEKENADLLRDHHRTVKFAREILQELFAMTFLKEDRHEADVGRPALSPIKKVKAKSSQKQAKKATRNLALNEKPFIALNLAVPKNREDAETTIADLIHRLKKILEFYLKSFRRAEIFNTITECFIPQERPNELKIVTEVTSSVDESAPLAPTTEDVPSAFPMVQPMKSALYFDSPNGFGKWRILISSQANSDIRDYHRRSKKAFDIIVKKIKELSTGHFSADNQKRLNGPTTEVPVFEAKMSRNLRLVYQVDCVPDFDNSSEAQVLRIFGIYTHTQMDTRLWKSVASYLSNRGKEYRLRCLERISHPQGGRVYLPASFPSSAEIDERPIQSAPDLPPDDVNQLHHIISLEKYVTLSKELLDSIEADRDVAFPFEVSKQERAVIQHPHSCYVLGRSGTGKTTTMLFKMLWIERAYQLSSGNTARPRQIFVTQSRVLASKVEEHFVAYFASLATASHTNHDISSSLTNKMNNTYEGDLFNEEDNVQWRNDLPSRYSELEDKHFPLFITNDRLYAMIEADIDDMLQHGISQSEHSHDFLPRKKTLSSRKGRLVTFDRFLGEYWPHFPQDVKKKFHPSLVFNEIMGVISGSEGTLLCPDGCLDRETYENLSARMQPTFGDHRGRFYDIFLSYRSLKTKLDDFDAADRTHAILRFFADKPLMGQKVDHLYVDEAQDNLLVDAYVLRMLCRNPDGLFWAGDTAQTISAGSSFRFDDLRAFLFRVEKQRQLNGSAVMMPFKPTPPKKFHLAVNYRSHAGIVNCAQSVVELITKYWPYTIDRLGRERGNADGAMPVFYTDIYPGFVQEGRFLSRSRGGHEKIELGAHQCILVRHDAAKSRLIEEIGKVGIVLTLYESKGLEFNDVFLYNFFHDSAVDASQWRVVLNEIERGKNASPQAAPTFDAIRHAAICSELKCLYVAITRARNNLRIADESAKGEPMRDLWESRHQIRSCGPSDDLSDFAAPSNKEDWAKRAKEFFDNDQFALARDCYEKAGREQSAAVADAYHKRAVARRSPVHSAPSKANTREAIFRSAAEAFSLCARNTTNLDAKNEYYRLSAECHEDGGNIKLAAQTYRLASKYTKAALLFRKLGRFEDVYEIITKFGNKMEPDVLESIRDVVRLYYVSRKEFRKAHDLFTTVEEEIEYLEDRDLDLAQLDLLLLHGRKMDAADLHVAEGRIVDAIDLFVDDDTDRQTSMSKAKECILQGLWELLPFGVLASSSEQKDDVDVLLERSRVIDESVMNKNDRDEIKMFKAIRSGEFDELPQLANSFLQARNGNAAVMCLDHYYERIPLLDKDIEHTARSLKRFFDYIHILHDLAFLVDPCNDARVWKLFAIKPQDDNFLVRLPSLLHRYALGTGSVLDNTLVLTKDELVEAFHGFLRDRLLTQVTRENDRCRIAPALTPCLRHIFYGDCDTATCNRAHITPDATWFGHWVNAHLLQILIYHSIGRIQFQAEMQSQQRFWLVKLYEALNSSHHSLGPTSNMHHNTGVVDFREAFNVLMYWVRSLSFSLQFSPAYMFLTIAMQTADFAFTFDKKEASVYMYRSKFATSPCPPRYIRGEYGQNALQELLIAFDEKGPSSLLMGILFIRHVMDAAIPVNINVFCSFIERVCGSLIAFNQYRWDSSFHGVILPRSWFKMILSRFNPVDARGQDTSRFWLLLKPLNALLRALHFSGSESSGHLLYGPEFRSLDRQGNLIRSMYISRICRVLGLLCSNIKVEVFRTEIHAMITSLREESDPSRGFPRLYASYVYAESYVDILRATRRSLYDSHFDDMIQLLHSSRIQSPVHEIFGLQRIVYSAQDDILSLLGGDPSHAASPVSVTAPSDLTWHPDREDEDHLSQEEEESNHPDVEDQNFIPKTEIPEDIYTGHSEEERAAASLIQMVFRKFLEKRRQMEEPGLAGNTCRWFVLFRKAMQPTMRFCTPPYKSSYLGPLPHLFSSMDAIQPLLLEKKAALKKRLLHGVDHEELDDVGTGLTRVNQEIKNLKRLQQTLAPGAALHHRHDLDELKRVVKETLELLRVPRVPVELPDDIRQELKLVHKGILQERKVVPKTTKKEKKPCLTMYDPQDLLQSDWEDDFEG